MSKLDLVSPLLAAIEKINKKLRISSTLKCGLMVKTNAVAEAFECERARDSGRNRVNTRGNLFMNNILAVDLSLHLSSAVNVHR